VVFAVSPDLFPAKDIMCFSTPNQAAGGAARLHSILSAVPASRWQRLVTALISIIAATGLRAQENLLKNPGFEEMAADRETPPGWAATADSKTPATASELEAHAGRRCLAIPANNSVEQHLEKAKAGAYAARFWVKSGAEQRVTAILSDPARPWAVYNCAEIKIPKGQWTQAEAFCPMDRDGSLTLTIGGTSKEFRAYHGPESEMRSPILVDDCELIRFEPKTTHGLRVWNVKDGSGSILTGPTDPRDAKGGVEGATFTESAAMQGRHLAATVRKSDGGLVIYGANGKSLNRRAAVVPAPAFKVAQITQVNADGRAGLRVEAADGGPTYTAWITDKGVVAIESKTVRQFVVQELRMAHGILPSFVGSDICYNPAKLPGVSKVAIPSTQWLVGLMEGHDSMLVAVWDSPGQAVSLGLSGDGAKRTFDSFSIDTGAGGFSLSFVEYLGIWGEDGLKDDYLGDYTAIGWQRPFPARWMADFFVTPGGKPSFHEPYNDYSFPVASAKTRMWGVWFEDWNRYPFYFDGTQTIAHFEKSFAPNGNALFYFLEPAAANLYSPCEIVGQVLGAEKAAALFDLDANQLRKLEYSTPPLFMYDRPVCATTTALSKIKQDEKPTVGVNLAAHLYEFIRGIRGRVDQYAAFFGETKSYLNAQKTAQPELAPYIGKLENLVDQALSKTNDVYETPLPAVEAKIEAMKKLLANGKGDGFDCGKLDVRGPAGEQDDLCRHYNRLVLRLEQTAALNCGDSPAKAVIAKHIWDRSREVLRRPTRWESRRTLYFFEP
jgi:hypothetical protein